MSRARSTATETQPVLKPTQPANETEGTSAVTQPVQPYPQGPAPEPWPPPPAKGKTRTWLWILAVVIALAIGYGAGSTQDSPSSSSDTTTDAPGPGVVADPEPEPELPDPSDVKIRVKVLEKECFGSAGCNLTYRIEPEYTGTATLPDDRTISIIYEVRGGEDGPQINTFTITGDNAEFDAEENISTSSSSKKLTAKATEVYWE